MFKTTINKTHFKSWRRRAVFTGKQKARKGVRPASFGKAFQSRGMANKMVGTTILSWRTFDGILTMWLKQKLRRKKSNSLQPSFFSFFAFSHCPSAATLCNFPPYCQCHYWVIVRWLPQGLNWHRAVATHPPTRYIALATPPIAALPFVPLP